MWQPVMLLTDQTVMPHLCLQQPTTAVVDGPNSDSDRSSSSSNSGDNVDLYNRPALPHPHAAHPHSSVSSQRQPRRQWHRYQPKAWAWCQIKCEPQEHPHQAAMSYGSPPKWMGPLSLKPPPMSVVPQGFTSPSAPSTAAAFAAAYANGTNGLTAGSPTQAVTGTWPHSIRLPTVSSPPMLPTRPASNGSAPLRSPPWHSPQTQQHQWQLQSPTGLVSAPHKPTEQIPFGSPISSSTMSSGDLVNGAKLVNQLPMSYQVSSTSNGPLQPPSGSSSGGGGAFVSPIPTVSVWAQQQQQQQQPQQPQMQSVLDLPPVPVSSTAAQEQLQKQQQQQQLLQQQQSPPINDTSTTSQINGPTTNDDTPHTQELVLTQNGALESSGHTDDAGTTTEQAVTNDDDYQATTTTTTDTTSQDVNGSLDEHPTRSPVSDQGQRELSPDEQLHVDVTNSSDSDSQPPPPQLNGDDQHPPAETTSLEAKVESIEKVLEPKLEEPTVSRTQTSAADSTCASETLSRLAETVDAVVEQNSRPSTVSTADELLRSASNTADGLRTVTPQTRPPGLGPPTLITSPLSLVTTQPLVPPPQTGLVSSTAPGPTVYSCPICGFTSASKFHFNSHMNTHTDHQCTMCDYTSRTEGRLKRHMKESHSREEQVEAGLSPTGAVSQVPSQAPMLNDLTSLHPTDDMSALEHMQVLAQRQDQSLMPTSITDAAMSAAGDRSSTSGSTPPKRTQSTKPKQYKCKQCGHVSMSKDESWAHARTHIPQEKQLTCPKCDFVTEYKHHLEYHLRNHFGSKPFQCTKCKYTCVNKSMLNSHMKSHSNYYQYRCSDCTYATKYCHSLKLHLRKYGHRPTTVLTSDGTQIDPSTLGIFGSTRPGTVTPRGPSATPGEDTSSPPSGPPSTAFLPVSLAGGTPSLNDSPGNLLQHRPPAMGAQLPLISAGLLAHQRQQLETAAIMQRMASLGLPVPSQLQTSVAASQPGPLQQSAESAFSAPNRFAPAGLPGTPGGPIGLAGLSLSLPRSNMPPQTQPPPLDDLPPTLVPPSPIRCPMCAHECASKDELLKHHLQTHMPDLANLYGLRRATPQQQLITDAAQHHHTLVEDKSINSNSTGPAAASTSAECSSGPTDGRPSLNGSSAQESDGSMGRYSEEPVQSPVTHDGSSTGSPKISADESGSGDGSTTKSRRKGKAYKLDQITRRLQNRGMSPTSSGEHGDDETERPDDGQSPCKKPKRDQSTEGGGAIGEAQMNGTSTTGVIVSAMKPTLPLNAPTTSTAASAATAAYVAALTAALQRRKREMEMSSGDSSDHSKESPSGSIGLNSLVPHSHLLPLSVNGAAALSSGNWQFACEHCRMAFEDAVLYHIHMGYHGYDNPFKCNRCGHTSHDALSHNLHLYQTKHE